MTYQRRLSAWICSRRFLIVMLCTICIYFIFHLTTRSNRNTYTSNDIIQNTTPKVSNVTCKNYNELHNVAFNSNKINPFVCKNAILYKKNSEGNYPACELSEDNSVIDNILDEIRRNSVLTYLAAPANAKIPMYTYNKEDLISRCIIELHDWENIFTTKLIAIAKSIPNVTFVDVGSNIGVFTLQAMKQNLSTLSFDANIRNLLRLRLSLIANHQNVQDRPLIWNFLRKRSNLQALSMPLDCNIGGSGSSAGIDVPGRVNDKIKIMPIAPNQISKFIKTPNVVMKMDIEGGENEFLLNSDGLFSSFNFIVVTVEFNARHKTIVDFFSTKNYIPFNPHIHSTEIKFTQLNLNDWQKWPVDLLWIKKDYVEQIMKVEI